MKTRAPQTEAFRRWFGASKVVHKDGRPRVMYHGASAVIDEFSLMYADEGSTFGQGFYFSNDESLARQYAKGVDGHVVAAYLSLQNPFINDYSMPFDERMKRNRVFRGGRVRERLIEAGYDGVLITEDDYVEAVAFYPTQIKAVDNVGTFDPEDPNIRHNGGPDMAGLVAMEAFFRRKWREEKGKDDLTGACKFATAFSKMILGGEVAGNWHHTFLRLADGQIVDLTHAEGVREQAEEALAYAEGARRGGHLELAAEYTPPGFVGPDVDPYLNDPKFLRSAAFKESWASVQPRMRRWAHEFQSEQRAHALPQRRNAVTFESLPDGRLVGWRAARYQGGYAVSGADSRQRAKLRRGELTRFTGAGMFLANDRQYVIDYYAGHDQSAVMRYAFWPEDVVKGNLEDAQAEISVKVAELLDFEVLRENPSLVRRTTIRKGTLLYHGTSAEEPFEEDGGTPDGPAWFTENPEVARFFSTWHGQDDQARILVYRVTQSIPDIATVSDSRGFEALERQLVRMGALDEECGQYEMAEAMASQRKYNGWRIVGNYSRPDGDDILLVSPEDYLEFVGLLE